MTISNRFTATLGEIRKGRALNDLSSRLAEVIEAVREHGGAGSLTLKLEIKPVNGNGDQVLITDDIKTKVPQAKKQATLFFTDEGGALLRNDPRQRDWVAEQLKKPEEEAADSKAFNES
jgi:hypothetical protein